MKHPQEQEHLEPQRGAEEAYLVPTKGSPQYLTPVEAYVEPVTFNEEYMPVNDDDTAPSPARGVANAAYRSGKPKEQRYQAPAEIGARAAPEFFQEPKFAPADYAVAQDRSGNILMYTGKVVSEDA